MNIGESLKYFRKKKGYTQTELAKLLNIKQSTYSGYETNYSEPDLKTLITLADIYDTSIDILINRTNIKQQKAV